MPKIENVWNESQKGPLGISGLGNQFFLLLQRAGSILQTMLRLTETRIGDLSFTSTPLSFHEVSILDLIVKLCLITLAPCPHPSTHIHSIGRIKFYKE